jgi:hypothetical protein
MAPFWTWRAGRRRPRALRRPRPSLFPGEVLGSPPPEQQQRPGQRQSGEEAADMGEDGDSEAGRLEGEADEDLQRRPGGAEPEGIEQDGEAGIGDADLVAAEQKREGAEQGR